MEKTTYKVTPLIGVTRGELNGAIINVKTGIACGKFLLYTEPEICFASERERSFLFSCSEVNYRLKEFLYAGLALQHTSYFQSFQKIELGIVLGFTIKDFEFPIYLFNPLQQNQYFVLGLHWQRSK
ncbi:MAG: hypothetical protein C4330_07725 [Chitinophagaceae bacterium]